MRRRRIDVIFDSSVVQATPVLVAPNVGCFWATTMECSEQRDYVAAGDGKRGNRQSRYARINGTGVG